MALEGDSVSVLATRALGADRAEFDFERIDDGHGVIVNRPPACTEREDVRQ